MRYFVKLNVMSAVFALWPFIISELLVNVYRMNRVTGIELEKINHMSAVISLLGSVIIFVLYFIVLKRFLPVKKMNFVLAVTWAPYYWIYIRVFANEFPMTYPYDKANPASGLIIMAGLLLYPFLLGVVNAIALLSKKTLL